MNSMIYALVFAFLAMMAIGPVTLPLLRRLKLGQNVRDDGPKSHLTKQGTPTMGGIMLVIASCTAALLFSQSDGRLTIMLPAILICLGFTLIGFIDDFIKFKLHRSLGLRAWQKIVMQIVFSTALALVCYLTPGIGSIIYLPFTGIYWDLGVFYIPFAIFIIIATVNSANLLDGLDGLLSGVTMIMMGTMAIIALFMVMQLMELEISANMMIFAGSCCGACLGFLRFNTHPAQVFMGDTGSFFLGSAFAVVCLFLRLPLIIPLVGFCYLISSVSDIIQIGSYKLRKKRVFRMAPLNHHFELGGMQETRVVAMYMILTAVLCLIALLAV